MKLSAAEDAMELAGGDEDKLGVAIESQADARACRR